MKKKERVKARAAVNLKGANMAKSVASIALDESDEVILQQVSKHLPKVPIEELRRRMLNAKRVICYAKSGMRFPKNTCVDLIALFLEGVVTEYRNGKTLNDCMEVYETALAKRKAEGKTDPFVMNVTALTNMGVYRFDVRKLTAEEVEELKKAKKLAKKKGGAKC